MKLSPLLADIFATVSPSTHSSHMWAREHTDSALRRVKGFPDPSLSQCYTSVEQMWVWVCRLQQQMETSGPCLGWLKYLRSPSPFCSLLLSLAPSILSLSVCLTNALSLSSHASRTACVCVYIHSFNLLWAIFMLFPSRDLLSAETTYCVWPDRLSPLLL